MPLVTTLYDEMALHFNCCLRKTWPNEILYYLSLRSLNYSNSSLFCGNFDPINCSCHATSGVYFLVKANAMKYIHVDLKISSNRRFVHTGSLFFKDNVPVQGEVCLLKVSL